MMRPLFGPLLSLLLLSACGPSSGPEAEPPAEQWRSSPSSLAGTTVCPIGNFRCVDVTIPEQGTGVPLDGRVYAPPTTAVGPFPLIGLLPGGGVTLDSVEWAATRLVASGYVVVSVTPQFGAQTGSYNLALKGALDFMFSSSNPFATATNRNLVGAAGWSIGARTLTQTQAEDPRLDAIVAWDNLAVRPSGDEGTPSACQSGRIPSGPTVVPRVPALGQASDSCTPYLQPVDSKKTAWAHWRAAGVPSMEVVLANSNHALWSASGSAANWDKAHYYTRAWFDRFLKGDTSATARLLERSNVLGQSLSQVLSTQFRSAAFLDGRDCADLRAACP